MIGQAIAIWMTVFLIVSCASTSPNKSVGLNSFNFDNYDFLVIEKSSPSLFEINSELGGLMQIYDMKVVTPQEYESLSPENKNRTLYTNISLDSEGEINILNISFEDATVRQVKNNFNGVAKGDMSNSNDRSKALQSVSNKIIKELKKDKGLIADRNKLLADERKAILPGMRSSSMNFEAKEYFVIADTLNVRKAPMVGFDVIEKVKEGDVLKKISSLSGWAKVALPSGKRGWVSMRYLQPISPTQQLVQN